MELVQLHQLATAYGQPPSRWLLTDAQRATPEGATLAFDLDRVTFGIGTAFEAEQREIARRTDALRRGDTRDAGSTMRF